jgi:hypothetical protein
VHDGMLSVRLPDIHDKSVSNSPDAPAEFFMIGDATKQWEVHQGVQLLSTQNPTCDYSDRRLSFK